MRVRYSGVQLYYCPCPNHYCPCPNHYGPCPTVRDRSSRVYSLVKAQFVKAQHYTVVAWTSCDFLVFINSNVLLWAFSNSPFFALGCIREQLWYTCLLPPVEGREMDRCGSLKLSFSDKDRERVFGTTESRWVFILVRPVASAPGSSQREAWSERKMGGGQLQL